MGKILVFQTAFLGDLVLGTPLFKRLKVLFPDSEITLVCRKGLGTTLKELNLVDRYFEIGKGDSSSYQKIVQTLKGQSFDLLLCPHESLRSALFVRQIKAKRKIGFHKWWNGLFFDQRIKKDPKLPEAMRQMSLLSEIWPEFKEIKYQVSPIPDWASMKISMPLSLHDMKSKFSLPSTYVCLFPGSVWATKKWTEEGFIQVGQAYAKKHIGVLVMGGPGEEELAARVASAIPNSPNLAAKTSLIETTTILSGAVVVITNDSGGQHLAALSGVPTVAIFGPTIPGFGFIPWNNKSVIVETEYLKCRPCGKHGHQVCPIGTHECMKKISAEMVLKAADNLTVRS